MPPNSAPTRWGCVPPLYSAGTGGWERVRVGVVSARAEHCTCTPCVCTLLRLRGCTAATNQPPRLPTRHERGGAAGRRALLRCLQVPPRPPHSAGVEESAVGCEGGWGAAVASRVGRVVLFPPAGPAGSYTPTHPPLPAHAPVHYLRASIVALEIMTRRSGRHPCTQPPFTNTASYAAPLVNKFSSAAPTLQPSGPLLLRLK